jgi:glycosyltransferase involved in cell wall biosynthesis
LLPSLGAGGAENSLAVTLPLMVEQGVEPLVAYFGSESPAAHQLLPEFEKLARTVEISGRGRWGRVRSLRRLLDEWRPTIVHAAVMEANLISRFSCLGRRTILLNSLVNTPYTPLRFLNPKTRAWKHRSLQIVDAVSSWLFVDHFHAVNQSVKDEGVKRLWIRPTKISVVHRGREGDRFKVDPSVRNEIRKSLGLSSDAFVILTVGRQCYQKGHIYLLKAFCRVRERCPNAKLLIAGKEGDSSELLSDFVAKGRLEEDVFLLGHRDDVPILMAGSDLFVFPSLFEGIGGAAIEAMAAGLPVVASDLSGLRETLGPLPPICFPPAADVGLLADSMLQCQADAEFRANQGLLNRQRFEKHFDVDSSAAEMVKLYFALSQRFGDRLR